MVDLKRFNLQMNKLKKEIKALEEGIKKVYTDTYNEQTIKEIVADPYLEALKHDMQKKKTGTNEQGNAKKYEKFKEVSIKLRKQNPSLDNRTNKNNKISNQIATGKFIDSIRSKVHKRSKGFGILIEPSSHYGKEIAEKQENLGNKTFYIRKRWVNKLAKVLKERFKEAIKQYKKPKKQRIKKDKLN